MCLSASKCINQTLSIYYVFIEILFKGDSESYGLLAHIPGLTVFESGPKKSEKRKKVKGGDAEEIDNFLGPWAKYADEKDVAKPSEVMLCSKYNAKCWRRLVLNIINRLAT